MNLSWESEAAEETRLRNLLGDEYDRLAEADDSDIFTVVVGRDQEHENVFLMFQNRNEVEYLISQLANLLDQDDNDLSTTIRGRVVSFRDIER